MQYKKGENMYLIKSQEEQVAELAKELGVTKEALGWGIMSELLNNPEIVPRVCNMLRSLGVDQLGGDALAQKLNLKKTSE